MDLNNKYLIYVGTARGALLRTQCKTDAKVQFSIPEKQSEITALEWGRCEDELIIGYKNEQLNLYSTVEDRYTRTISKLEGEGPIVGVAPLNNSIVIAKQEGIITIWNEKSSDYFSINLEEKASLDAIGYNKNRDGVVGTGGECNDFKVWDLETKQCIFKAKSLGHDELNLPIPTSIRGITFIPENEKLNACATKEGHVLLYDERAQRRPVTKFFEKKASYNCITSAFRERQCLVGSTRGYMQLLDLRIPGKCLKTFTEFLGSVTSIVCDPEASLVCSTSLDRLLRINNIENKDLLYKAYLKQNLTKVVMRPLVKNEDETENPSREGVDEEYEELFNNMEVISDKKRKSEADKASKEKKKKKKTSK